MTLVSFTPLSSDPKRADLQLKFQPLLDVTGGKSMCKDYLRPRPADYSLGIRGFFRISAQKATE
jgi:hypothetical protein